MSTPATAEHTLKFGLHMNKPLNFRGTDGQAKGLVVDVFKHIAKQEGWKVSFHPCKWSQCLSRLKSGEIDVLSAIGYTDKRAETYTFTETTLITNWGLVITQPDTDILSLTDLHGTTIAVLPRAGHTTMLKALLDKFGVNANFLEVDSFKAVMQAVSDKKADAGVVNRLVAQQFAKDYQILKSSIIYNPIEIRYAFTKGTHPEIPMVIDSYLQEMRIDKNSVYFKSLERWFGQGEDAPLPRWLKWLAGTMSLFTGLLMVIAWVLNNRVEAATAQVREGAASFKTVIEAGPLSLIISDTKTNQLLFINDRARSMFAIPDDAKESDFQTSDFFNDGEDQRILAEMLAQGGTPDDHEVQLKRLNGSTFWGSATTMVMPFNGTTTIATSILDISRRKQAEVYLQRTHDELEQRVVERTQALTDEVHERRTIEQELFDKTEILQLLFEITAIANEADDTDAAMAQCLQIICDYTSWPIGHIYTISPKNHNRLIPTNIWHMEDTESFAAFKELTMKSEFDIGIGLPGRVLANRKPVWIEDASKDDNFPRAQHGVDIPIKACFGFPIIVRNKIVAVMEFFSPFDQKSNQLLMQSIEHIGTHLGRLHERALAAENLLEAKKNAEIANTAKSDFLSSMSHELRTPLNAIIGFSDSIGNEMFGPVDNEKYSEYIGDINHSGQHLLKLINDILDVSAIEAGALELQEETVNINDVVNSAISLISPRAEEGKVSVASTIDTTIPKVHVDVRRMQQIMLNLLSNAVKFTPQGGEVIIGAHNNARGILAITVSDTGIGMDEAEISIALNRFGQVDTGLDRKHEGTGLGLPLTQELIGLHGGHLEIKSNKGFGTTITVTIPGNRIIEQA
ncbi:MAG: transporter substrate-binding domain-containing protein [Rhodospirillaceae bacterium]|nr:transporter substrate-binding domain-containing protein [Rhodospirillaceae bacterium]MBT6407319.1 transporter substrate-binding domain-containing protein [Rhodospirillaceae bacterium]